MTFFSLNCSVRFISDSERILLRLFYNCTLFAKVFVYLAAILRWQDVTMVTITFFHPFREHLLRVRFSSLFFCVPLKILMDHKPWNFSQNSWWIFVVIINFFLFMKSNFVALYLFGILFYLKKNRTFFGFINAATQWMVTQCKYGGRILYKKIVFFFFDKKKNKMSKHFFLLHKNTPTSSILLWM